MWGSGFFGFGDDKGNFKIKAGDNEVEIKDERLKNKGLYFDDQIMWQYLKDVELLISIGFEINSMVNYIEGVSDTMTNPEPLKRYLKILDRVRFEYSSSYNNSVYSKIKKLDEYVEPHHMTMISRSDLIGVARNTDYALKKFQVSKDDLE